MSGEKFVHTTPKESSPAFDSTSSRSLSKLIKSSSFLSTKYTWREAVIEDVPLIEKLADNEVRKFFGDVRFTSLIELSPHSVVIQDSSNSKIVGFLCLNNYPNISALCPEVWTHWMRHHYKLNELQYHNTLFVHYLAWNHILRVNYLHVYLEDLFLAYVQLEYICMVAPPNDAGLSFVKNSVIKLLFSWALPFGSYGPGKTQTLHICFRSSLVQKLKIRRALPEDNDDLVEILDRTAPKLRGYYGDYYIAEMVAKNEPNRSIIVAEVNNQTVGMMCLNTNLDLDKLNENFHLLPFNALRKHSFNMGFEIKEIREIVARESKIFFAELDAEELDPDFGLELSSQSIYVGTSVSDKTLDKQIAEKKDSHSKLNRVLDIQKSEATISTEFSHKIMKEWEETLKKFSDRQAYYEEYTQKVKLPTTASNVMAIELFGMTSKLDERNSIELLKAAFDTYKEYDYCLLTLPPTAYLPKFLTYFTKAIPRSQCSFPDSLYLIHKNNLFATLSVSHMGEHHLQDVYNLIGSNSEDKMKPADEISEMCTDFILNPESIYDILIVHSETTVVGLIILRTATSLYDLRRTYALDAYENFEIACSPASFGQIAYCLLNPLFISSSGFIFKEIFRLTGFTSVFYAIRNEYNYFDFYNSLLPTMFPIKPRRILALPSIENFADIEPNPKAYEDPGTSAIFYMNVRLCTFPRKQIDARIVVVGFGQTSKTFLETLIYRELLVTRSSPGRDAVLTIKALSHGREYSVKPLIRHAEGATTQHRQHSQHLRFTNLTCICPAGILESDMSYAQNYGKLLSPDKLFSRRYLKQLEFRVWVNFVPGYMTNIDRKNKFIVVDKKSRIPYDELFLFCGVQFDVPIEVFNEKTPANLILINKQLHGKMAQYRIRKLVENTGFKIIVYGCVPKAYAGVNYLLNAGVKGSDIHFVIPPLQKNDDLITQIFDDDFVEAIVHRELQNAGVNVYKDYKFVKWNVNEKDNWIKSITFESCFECITLQCALFISYYRKVVNRITVRALNRSGLVFDGRIVIDADNRTNDPHIYAAGPLTKYRRILYADRFRHMYYNSREIGMKIAMKVVNMYTRDEDKTSSTQQPFRWIVAQYTYPLVESIILPGNYYYLHVHRPGVQLPNYLARTLDQYGMDLVTGCLLKTQKAPPFLDEQFAQKCNMIEEKQTASQDYCRIYLDQHGFVKTIVCLSKKLFDGQNMIRLWGLHEKLLNNLKCKYLKGEITDLFEFFSERWTHILHHDKFPRLQELNERIYQNNLDGNSSWLSEFLAAETNNYKQELPEETRKLLIRYYQSEEFATQIRKNLLNFITENQESLFMYATAEALNKQYK